MPSSLRPEDLLAAILSSNADGLLFFALDGTILTWSEGATRLYGYTPPEMIGRSLTLLMPNGEAEALAEFLRGARKGHSAQLTHAERLKKDGSRVRVCAKRSAVPNVKGEVVAIVETAWESEPRAEKQHPGAHDQLLQQMPAVVWTVDQDLRITSNWGEGLKRSDIQPGELVGRTLHEFLRCQDAHATPISLHAEALRGVSSQFEYRYNDRDFEIHVSPLRGAKGEITGCIGAGIDITERKRWEQQMCFQATHDALTGLANYRKFSETLEQEVRRASRNNRPFGLLLLDLDDLKRVNDRFGHLAGNRALRRLAAVLLEHCRETDLAARYGGDEFAVLLVDADAGMCRNIAARIIKALRKDREQPPVSASIGCAVYPADGRNAQELVEAADEELYKRKKNERSARVTA